MRRALHQGGNNDSTAYAFDTTSETEIGVPYIFIDEYTVNLMRCGLTKLNPRLWKRDS
jgi:hypothetical protein